MLRSSNIKRYILILFFAGVAAIPWNVYLQDNPAGKSRKKYDILKQEIEQLKKELDEKDNSEKRSFELIQDYNKKLYRLNTLIGELELQAREKLTEIEDIQQKINISDGKIRNLKLGIAKYLRYMHKKMFVDETLIILSGSSVSEIISRYIFFRRIAEQGRRQMNSLKESIAFLEKGKMLLQQEKKNYDIIRGEKETEKDNLTGYIKKQKVLIEELRKDKNILKAELESKGKSVDSIKIIIASLDSALPKKTEKKNTPKPEIKKPEKKVPEKTPPPAEEEKTPVITAKEPVEYTFDIAFGKLKGKLGWPVTEAKLIRKFGENTNEKLHTVTMNYGVDLKVNSARSVKVVAQGYVSLINWLPGYGTIIIVTHSDGYRTIYGNLGVVSVNEGDKVTGGQVLGTVGESLEGYVLHFEIWHKKTNLNPGQWLASK